VFEAKAKLRAYWERRNVAPTPPKLLN